MLCKIHWSTSSRLQKQYNQVLRFGVILYNKAQLENEEMNSLNICQNPPFKATKNLTFFLSLHTQSFIPFYYPYHEFCLAYACSIAIHPGVALHMDVHIALFLLDVQVSADMSAIRTYHCNNKAWVNSIIQRQSGTVSLDGSFSSRKLWCCNKESYCNPENRLLLDCV